MGWRKPVVSIGLTFGVLAILAVVGSMFVDTAPPRSLTHAHMHMMKRRILRYAAAHDRLPPSLGELPRIDGFANEVTDGWGRPIHWRVEGNEVILISHGRDGAPGGAGEDADMIGVFRAKTPDGRWADEFCEWRDDPLRQR